MESTPRLSIDVFYAILELLETRELVRISTVCKLYHAPALKRLLSSTDIRLLNNPRLVQFCACILADPTVRGPWVKTLDISSNAFQRSRPIDSTAPIVDFSTLSMLAAVLEHCDHLATLRVTRLSELLYADPQLGVSIAALPALTELSLSERAHLSAEATALISEVLGSMQSRLRVLRMQCDMYFTGSDSFDFPLHNPTAFASTASIEVLDLCHVNFPPGDAQYPPWPSVRELHMPRGSIDILRIFAILPNLKVCELDGQVYVHSSEADFLLWRNFDNLQVDYNHMDVLVWKNCPTRRIQLSGYLEGSYPRNEDDMLMVLDLVRDSRPVVLILWPVDAQVGLRSWRALCEADPDLRCLELWIMPTLLSDKIGYLTGLLWALAELPLVYLAIDLLIVGTPQDDQGMQPVYPFPPHILDAFAQKIPTLRYLAVTPQKRPSSGFDYWHIIRPGTSTERPQLKQLTHVEGKDVRKRLLDMDRESLLHFDLDRFIAH